MESLAIDAELARARLEAAGDRVVAMLRSGPDGEAAVPGLDWTAGECAAHLVTSLRWGAAYARGEPAPAATPAGLADVNAERLVDLDDRDPCGSRTCSRRRAPACSTSFVDETPTSPSRGTSARPTWTWRR